MKSFKDIITNVLMYFFVIALGVQIGHVASGNEAVTSYAVFLIVENIIAVLYFIFNTFSVKGKTK